MRVEGLEPSILSASHFKWLVYTIPPHSLGPTARNRTWNESLEGSCDIRFTTVRNYHSCFITVGALHLFSYVSHFIARAFTKTAQPEMSITRHVTNRIFIFLVPIVWFEQTTCCLQDSYSTNWVKPALFFTKNVFFFTVLTRGQRMMIYVIVKVVIAHL